jgi:hypothetical protein
LHTQISIISKATTSHAKIRGAVCMPYVRITTFLFPLKLKLAYVILCMYYFDNKKRVEYYITIKILLWYLGAD